ncbi:hypothetical protein [Parasulfitobacter algicola]|uniref:Uncharacterized protein n=1 Tax=Parasulfitobacter algicola TaxID=2614809 RepID=A0ABX2IM29_9RHOB|nr:hypothetical protein [Sulfitobacter algicola]NSX53929.1 hypothetical protein [Sulfitobacter algicola]
MQKIALAIQPVVKIAAYVGIFIGICGMGLGLAVIFGIAPPPPDDITGFHIIVGSAAFIAVMILQLFIFKYLINQVKNNT